MSSVYLLLGYLSRKAFGVGVETGDFYKKKSGLQKLVVRRIIEVVVFTGSHIRN